MWIDGEWAYYYCRDVEDDPEIRKYIINSRFAYYYCRDVKDDPEIRKRIAMNSYWSASYCENVKNRPEVRKCITDLGHIDLVKKVDIFRMKFKKI